MAETRVDDQPANEPEQLVVRLGTGPIGASVSLTAAGTHPAVRREAEDPLAVVPQLREALAAAYRAGAESTRATR